MRRAASAVVTLVFICLLPPWVWAKKRYDSWVFIDSSDKNQMSGNTRDLKAARALQKNGEPLVYVRTAGKAWVIRDAATLERVRAAWRPLDAPTQKMEVLGKKMEAVGAKQEVLGKKMEELGNRMGKLGEQLGGMRADDPGRGRVEAEMNDVSRKMDVLGKQMDGYGREMQPISDEMDKLGEEIERLADRAENEFGGVVDDAIGRGLAIEVR